jgi:hypothetical protein
MKFKNLRNLAEEFSKLNENSSTNVAAPEFHAGTPIGDVDSNHMYIENQQNRDKLNFWLKTMNPTNKPVYNMHDFLINVRMKLNLAGYDIPVTRQTEMNDHMVFELNQFGGRSGMNENGKYFKDDGISHKNNGVSIKLIVDCKKMESGEYTVEMKLQS